MNESFSNSCKYYGKLWYILSIFIHILFMYYYINNLHSEGELIFTPPHRSELRALKRHLTQLHLNNRLSAGYGQDIIANWVMLKQVYRQLVVGCVEGVFTETIRFVLFL